MKQKRKQETEQQQQIRQLQRQKQMLERQIKSLNSFARYLENCNPEIMSKWFNVSTDFGKQVLTSKNFLTVNIALVDDIKNYIEKIYSEISLQQFEKAIKIVSSQISDNLTDLANGQQPKSYPGKIDTSNMDASEINELLHLKGLENMLLEDKLPLTMIKDLLITAKDCVKNAKIDIEHQKDQLESDLETLVQAEKQKQLEKFEAAERERQAYSFKFASMDHREKVNALNERVKQLREETDSRILTAVISVFNKYYENSVNDETFDVINKVLDLCELKETKKSVDNVKSAVIDSLDKVAIIEEFLRETSVIEQDILSPVVYKTLWGNTTTIDQAIQKLRQREITKEQILMSKILNENEGVLVQTKLKNKNFTKTADNIESIISSLKQLFPNEEEITILDMLKNAATTVLEIERDGIDKTIEFLTYMYDAQVLESPEIQGFIKNNIDEFKKFGLVEKDGKYVVSSADHSLENALSLHLGKMLLASKPSLVINYVTSRVDSSSIKQRIINQYGREAFNKFALMLLEEDGFLLYTNLDQLGEKMAILSASAAQINAPDKFVKKLGDIEYVRGEMNANRCVSAKNQKLFGGYNQNNVSANLKILLENYSPATVTKMLQTNLSVLQLNPEFLKALFSEVYVSTNEKTKFAKSYNAIMFTIAGKSWGDTAKKSSERNGYARRRSIDVIEVIKNPPEYDEIDVEKLSEEELAMLENLNTLKPKGGDSVDDDSVEVVDYDRAIQHIKTHLLLGKAYDMDSLDKMARLLPREQMLDLYYLAFLADLDEVINLVPDEIEGEKDYEHIGQLIMHEKQYDIFEKIKLFSQEIQTSPKQFALDRKAKLDEFVKEKLQNCDTELDKIGNMTRKEYMSQKDEIDAKEQQLLLEREAFSFYPALSEKSDQAVEKTTDYLGYVVKATNDILSHKCVEEHRQALIDQFSASQSQILGTLPENIDASSLKKILAECAKQIQNAPLKRTDLNPAVADEVADFNLRAEEAADFLTK